MSSQCPRCQSTHISSRNYGRKVGGTVGTTAGTVGGVTTALSSAQVGATIGMFADLSGQSLVRLKGQPLVDWSVEWQGAVQARH